jgi:hypothetical protein
MILGIEVRKRLLTVLQLNSMGPDWDRTRESAVNFIVPEVMKIIKEEVSKVRKNGALPIKDHDSGHAIARSYSRTRSRSR